MYVRMGVAWSRVVRISKGTRMWMSRSGSLLGLWAPVAMGSGKERSAEMEKAQSNPKIGGLYRKFPGG